MKPFHVRGMGWLTIASLVAVAALAWNSGREATTPAPAIARAPEPATGPVAASEPARDAEPAPIAARETPTAVAATARVAKLVRAEDSRPAPASVGGRMIAIDPETGAPGAPSPEQVQALRSAAEARASVSRSHEGLLETRLPNGTVILDLDGRFQDFTLARVDRHGNPHLGCVHDDGGLAKTLRDTIPVPALEVE